ncbi:hypothetical protein GN156_14870 [bacterium LRH843]|nr:hypothetical protein [bacterium LRH843]
MKNFPIIVFIAILFLSACSEEKIVIENGDAVIQEAVLTDFEQNLLAITNNRSLVYDIQVKNDEIKELYATVDYYKNSEFVRRIIEFSTSLSEVNQEDTIRTAFMQHHATETKNNGSLPL